jgi:hypothetical protein
LCRNARETKAGIATNGASWSRLIRWEDSDISAASNSRCLVIRKKVSSIARRP